jgi:hypothetical protein
MVIILCVSSNVANKVTTTNMDKLKFYIGTLTILIIDDDSEKNSIPIHQYYLNTSDNIYNITFTYSPHPTQKSLISVYGVLENNNLLIYNHTLLVSNYQILNDAIDANAGNAGNAVTKTKTVGVFFMKLQGKLCGFPDSASTCDYCKTIEELKNLFYADPNLNVRDFFFEMSEGQLDLKIQVFEVPSTYGPTDLYATMNEAVKNTINVNPNDFDHAIFLLPWNWYKVSPFTSFTVAGVGETPGKRTWINSCNIDTILHELGHNYNFGHSNAFDHNGNRQQYADTSSIMGFSIDTFKRGINSIHREIAGWLPKTSIVKTNTTGKWKILRLNNYSDKLKTRVIIFTPENTSNTKPFYIEFRQKITYDSQLSSPLRFVTPTGNYYDSLLIRQLVLTGQYSRKDTELLAIVQVNQTYTIDKKYSIIHSELGVVTIQKYVKKNKTKTAHGFTLQMSMFITLLVLIISIVL